MDSAVLWISVIGGSAGILVAIGGIVVFVRGAWDKGTIASLKENNETLDARVVLLEAENTRLKLQAAADKLRHEADMTALRLRLEVLEAGNAELRAQRPSAEAIAAVYALEQSIYSDTQAIRAAVAKEQV